MTDVRQNIQYAPYPGELEAAVEELHGVSLFDGWRFWLSDEPRDFADPDARTHPTAGGLTFNIHVQCKDSYHPERPYPGVHHTHPVPAATFNRQSWERWLFDRIMDSLTHEAGECLIFGQRRPFAALHGPGDNPYVVHEWSSDDQRRTSFRGEVNQ